MFEQNNRMKVHQGELKSKSRSRKRVPNNAINPKFEIPQSSSFYVPLLKKENCSKIQNASQIIVLVKLVFVKVSKYYTCSNCSSKIEMFNYQGYTLKQTLHEHMQKKM